MRPILAIFCMAALPCGAYAQQGVSGMLTAGTGSPAYLQMRGGAPNPQIACALNTGSNCSILFKPQGTGGLNFQNGNGGDSIEILGTSVSPGDTLQYVPNNAGPAVFTASIGAMFTGAGSGTSLTVTPISGVIHPGSASTATITGTGVPGSTYIVSQTSGTPGGAGVYVTNNPTTSSGASITSTSTTMDVTGTTSGTIAVGQSDSGLGIASGTMLTALISGGGTGGVGTYTISPAQYAPSTTAAALGSTVTLQTSNGAPITLNPSLALAGAVSFNNNGIAATTQQKFQSAFNVTGIDSDIGQQAAGIFNINANFQNSTNFASAPPAMSLVTTQLGTGYARGITGLQVFANLTSTPTNVPSTWATTTTYGNGSMMYDASADLFQTFTGGTTGSIAPTLTSCNPSCTDGTVTWTYTGASLYGIAGTVASQVYGEINANQGGTAAATMGTGWGLLGGVIVGTGGTYTQAVTAQELDINVAPTGTAAPGSLVGLGIYTQAAGQGRFVDTALSIAGNTGNYRKNGIQFGSTLDPNAGVGLSVYDSRGNAQYGAGLIDCSQCGSFAGTQSQFGNDAPFILKSPYFNLLATGDMRVGYGLIHVTSNGFTLDVPNYAITGNSSFSGGTGWINGEEACDSLGNCGTVTQSGGVPSGITVYTHTYMPISALPFATPETWHAVSISNPGPTGGTTEGTPFTTVESYTLASSPTIGIGGVSATAVNLGNSGSITTVAGALNATGALTLSASGTALSVANNAAIGGTLGVTGAATFPGGASVTGLAVTGSLTVNGQIISNQGGSLGTAAYVSTGTSGAMLGMLNASKTDSGANTYSGADTFSASGTALSVTNNAAIGGTLGVTGAATISGGASITGLAVADSFTAIGLVTPSDLAMQAANTVLTNATSGSASPTAQSMSSCSAPGNALNWTTNTGFGCSASITAAAVPASGLTGTTLPSNVTTSSLTSAAGGTFGTGAYAAAYALPTATSSLRGGVNPDNATIVNTAGAISVAYGTVASTAAQGNDSRITGALAAATAATTYAPLASPTFSGTVAAPVLNLTLAGTALSLGASSNATFGGTLGVTGNATLSSGTLALGNSTSILTPTGRNINFNTVNGAVFGIFDANAAVASKLTLQAPSVATSPLIFTTSGAGGVEFNSYLYNQRTIVYSGINTAGANNVSGINGIISGASSDVTAYSPNASKGFLALTTGHGISWAQDQIDLTAGFYGTVVGRSISISQTGAPGVLSAWAGSTAYPTAGTLVSNGTNTYQQIANATTTGSIIGTALTVTSGAGIASGMMVTGNGVTTGTTVSSGSGTAWVITPSQTVTSTSMQFTGGTSASSGGPTGIGSTINDGSVVWTYISPIFGSNLSALSSNVFATYNLGGTTANPVGIIQSGNDIASIAGAASGYFNEVAREEDCDVAIGLAPFKRACLQIVSGAAGDHATFQDAGLTFGGTGTGNFMNDIVFTDTAIDPNGTLITAWPWNVGAPLHAAVGIDLMRLIADGVGPSGGGSIVRWRNGDISNPTGQYAGGNLNLGAASLAVTSTGLTIDVPNYALTATSAFSGGTGWSANQAATDKYGNQGTVTESGGVPSAVTITRWHHDPANLSGTGAVWVPDTPSGNLTATGTPAVPTSFTTTETWAMVSTPTIGIGIGVATAINIGNSSSTTTLTGILKGAAATFTANGSVATTMTSLGPTGSHATVQEWFTVTDTGGTVRYIPAY